MIEEPFFPFLVDKNPIEIFLKMGYKCNCFDSGFDYFSIIESLHEISRVLTNLSLQKLDLLCKRNQHEFDINTVFLNLNTFIFHVNAIAEKVKLDKKLYLIFDKQIKSMSISFNDSNFMFKLLLYSSQKVTISLESLVVQLQTGMDLLQKALAVLENKWYYYIVNNSKEETLTLADYVWLVKIHLDQTGFECLQIFTHFYIMSSVKYSDSINVLALQRYQKIMKDYLKIIHDSTTPQNYNSLIQIVNLPCPSQLEEDMSITKHLIQIRSNSYYVGHANFIFRQNRDFIFEHLYWEDDLSDSAKYGLFFLALLYYNIEEHILSLEI